MPKTKTDNQRLEEIRQQIRTLEDERSDIETRPVSRDEAVEALDQWIEHQARQFRDNVNVGNLLRGEAFARLYFVTGNPVDWTYTLAALVPDTIRDFYIARIDEELARRTPISDADRQQRRQEIDGELVKLQREEETVLARMEDRGEQVVRRGDMDIRAFLGLDAAPRRPAPPQPDAADSVQRHRLGDEDAATGTADNGTTR